MPFIIAQHSGQQQFSADHAANEMTAIIRDAVMRLEVDEQLEIAVNVTQQNITRNEDDDVTDQEIANLRNVIHTQLSAMEVRGRVLASHLPVKFVEDGKLVRYEITII